MFQSNIYNDQNKLPVEINKKKQKIMNETLHLLSELNLIPANYQKIVKNTSNNYNNRTYKAQLKLINSIYEKIFNYVPRNGEHSKIKRIHDNIYYLNEINKKRESTYIPPSF